MLLSRCPLPLLPPLLWWLLLLVVLLLLLGVAAVCAASGLNRSRVCRNVRALLTAPGGQEK